MRRKSGVGSIICCGLLRGALQGSLPAKGRSKTPRWRSRLLHSTVRHGVARGRRESEESKSGQPAFGRKSEEGILSCIRRRPADSPVSGHRQVRESVENERGAFRATRDTSPRGAQKSISPNDRLLLLTSLSY